MVAEHFLNLDEIYLVKVKEFNVLFEKVHRGKISDSEKAKAIKEANVIRQQIKEIEKKIFPKK